MDKLQIMQDTIETCNEVCEYYHLQLFEENKEMYYKHFSYFNEDDGMLTFAYGKQYCQGDLTYHGQLPIKFYKLYIEDENKFEVEIKNYIQELKNGN